MMEKWWATLAPLVHVLTLLKAIWIFYLLVCTRGLLVCERVRLPTLQRLAPNTIWLLLRMAEDVAGPYIAYRISSKKWIDAIPLNFTTFWLI